jgi:hypothetical protein
MMQMIERKLRITLFTIGTSDLKKCEQDGKLELIASLCNRKNWWVRIDRNVPVIKDNPQLIHAAAPHAECLMNHAKALSAQPSR